MCTKSKLMRYRTCVFKHLMGIGDLAIVSMQLPLSKLSPRHFTDIWIQALQESVPEPPVPVYWTSAWSLRTGDRERIRGAFGRWCVVFFCKLIIRHILASDLLVLGRACTRVRKLKENGSKSGSRWSRKIG